MFQFRWCFFGQKTGKWCCVLCSVSWDTEAQSLITVHFDHSWWLRWCLRGKAFFFLLSLVSLLAESASFLKVPRVILGCLWGWQKYIKMEEVGDVFVRKSYLDLEGVKVGVQLRSRKSETKVSWRKWSNFEICAARSYRLEMNPVWRNVPDWIEGSRRAWIVVNHVCPGSVTFSPVLRAWERKRVFSKGHSALVRGADLELWAPAALKHAALAGQVTRLRSPVD